MKTIKFECPQCHEIIVGDESSYDQQVQCSKCQAAMLVPQKPVNAVPQTARLIEESGVAVPGALDESVQETDIFRLFPVARAFLGQIMLGAIWDRPGGFSYDACARLLMATMGGADPAHARFAHALASLDPEEIV